MQGREILGSMTISETDREKIDELRNIVKEHSGLTGEAVRTPNCIVNIEQTGGNDYWGMLNTYPINEILRARIHDLESMLRAVMELEKKNGNLIMSYSDK
ncbi:hypothetical protein TELCIR_17056, partial [Teladorsagia circumcincta]